MVEASEADELHKRVERYKLDSMLGFCELTGCRRQALLRYFGEISDKPCGNCDNCLNPPDTWDGTDAARKALSCVYRTGQRFGAHHIIDVLRGKSNERIQRLGHDRLSTFGIGQELDEKQWLSVFRQIIAQGYLTVDWEAHGALRLTEDCRPVLRGEVSLSLRKDSYKEAASAGRRHVEARFSNPDDDRLWQALRALRRNLAEQQNVPAYVIFQDAVLMEMVQARPGNRTELKRLAGIGERKLQLYGDEFLAVILEHGSRDGSASTASTTADESLALFRLGMNAEQIAYQRGLTITTVYGHLARAIETGAVELGEVVGLSDSEIGEIEAVRQTLPEDQRHALKPLYQALNGKFSYEVLRCIRAHHDRHRNSSGQA
jgi:ATP-dependent DNA helicase RecQ